MKFTILPSSSNPLQLFPIKDQILEYQNHPKECLNLANLVCTFTLNHPIDLKPIITKFKFLTITREVGLRLHCPNIQISIYNSGKLNVINPVSIFVAYSYVIKTLRILKVLNKNYSFDVKQILFSNFVAVFKSKLPIDIQHLLNNNDFVTYTIEFPSMVDLKIKYLDPNLCSDNSVIRISNQAVKILGFSDLKFVLQIYPKIIQLIQNHQFDFNINRKNAKSKKIQKKRLKASNFTLIFIQFDSIPLHFQSNNDQDYQIIYLNLYDYLKLNQFEDDKKTIFILKDYFDSEEETMKKLKKIHGLTIFIRDFKNNNYEEFMNFRNLILNQNSKRKNNLTTEIFYNPNQNLSFNDWFYQMIHFWIYL
jgi:TATA-box binding protein (TBP) (component of TFIID and TFIIIB)